MCAPTTYPARTFAANHPAVTVLPERGFVTAAGGLRALGPRDEIDAHVRADLDAWERDGDVAFVGADGPRRRRPPGGRGPDRRRRGFVRQVMGCRDFVWHLYWHFGPDYRSRNALDATEPVMVPNVVGMSQHADGGLLATKPDAGGRLHQPDERYCGGCAFHPKVRVGEQACPFTAGYRAFLRRHRGRFAANPRMRQPVASLDRLRDLPELLRQETDRGTSASLPGGGRSRVRHDAREP